MIIRKTLKERRRPTTSDHYEHGDNVKYEGIRFPCLLCRDCPLLMVHEYENHLISVHNISFHIPWIVRKNLKEGKRKMDTIYLFIY